MTKIVYDARVFVDVCNTAINMADAQRRLGLHPTTFRRIAKKLGCYKPNPYAKSVVRCKNITQQEVIDRYLSNKQPIAPARLRKLLIQCGLKNNCCERCGLSEWRGEPIPLELHHIDADRYNNNIKNLQVLCPTCHAQLTNGSNTSGKPPVKISTETIRRNYPDAVCIEPSRLVDVCCLRCGKQFTARLRPGEMRKYCSYECARAASRRFSISAEELLQRLTETTNYTTLGKELGVTANAIKRRCKSLGILDKVDQLIADAKVQRGKDQLAQIHTVEARRNNVISRHNNIDDFVGYDVTFDGLKEACRFRSREDLEAAGYNYAVVCRACRGMYHTYKKLVWRREKKTK